MSIKIIGTDCENCKHYKELKNRNKVKCLARDRTYYYGQCIDCDDKEVVVGNRNKQNNTVRKNPIKRK